MPVFVRPGVAERRAWDLEVGLAGAPGARVVSVARGVVKRSRPPLHFGMDLRSRRELRRGGGQKRVGLFISAIAIVGDARSRHEGDAEGHEHHNHKQYSSSHFW